MGVGGWAWDRVWDRVDGRGIGCVIGWMGVVFPPTPSSPVGKASSGAISYI